MILLSTHFRNYYQLLDFKIQPHFEEDIQLQKINVIPLAISLSKIAFFYRVWHTLKEVPRP